jgi:hypothetical protein
MRDGLMGDFLRLDLTEGGAICMLATRAHFDRRKPIAVRGRVRNAGGPWGALLLYVSDCEDAGFTWRVGSCEVRYHVNLPWVPAGIGSILDGWADFEIRWDGAGTVRYAAAPRGEAMRELGELPCSFSADPPVLFAGTPEGHGGWIDLAGLEIEGEEVFGFTESNPLWGSLNGGSVGGTEWRYGYPQDGSPHFHPQGGGWSVRRDPADTDDRLFDMITTGDPLDHYTYPAGAARLRSPEVVPAPGHRFRSLRAIGSTRSGGELKIRVLDATGRPIEGLPMEDGLRARDAEGECFTPVYGAEMAVDLRGLDASPIRIVVDAVNPNDGVRAECAWSPPGGPPAPGADTGPPILKALSVDFF